MFEELLTEISESSPCGENLKYDILYDQIREARREDDPRLSQGVWQTELKRANWAEVKKLCSNALMTKTKDVQIAMWYLEALIATEGFKGLSNGLDFLFLISEKFWDNIYPQIEGDMGFRVAPFFLLTTQISDKIILIPLTQVSDDTGLSYNLADWITARHNVKIKNTKGLDLKTVLKAISFTSLEFLENIKSEVELSKEKIQKLSDFLYKKCGDDAPGFQPVLNILDDILRTNEKNLEIKRIEVTKEKAKKANASQSASLEPEHHEETPEATVSEAYRVLGNIAIFLEQHQPQSPASTLIKIAQMIGEKTFQDLLEMDMKNNTSIMTTISELYKMTNKKSLDEKNDVPTPEEVRQRLGR